MREWVKVSLLGNDRNDVTLYVFCLWKICPAQWYCVHTVLYVSVPAKPLCSLTFLSPPDMNHWHERTEQQWGKVQYRPIAIPTSTASIIYKEGLGVQSADREGRAICKLMSSLEYWTRRWINPSALIDITSADFEATVLMLPRSVFG
jgi:hypothetical protein